MPSKTKDRKSDTQAEAAKEMNARMGATRDHAAEIRQGATQDAAKARLRHQDQLADLQRRHKEIKQQITQHMETKNAQPDDRTSISRQADNLATQQEDRLQRQIAKESNVLGRIAREAAQLQEQQLAESRQLAALGNTVGPDAVTRISEHHQAQQTRLQDLAREVNKTLSEYAQKSDELAKAARDEFRKAVANNENPADLEARRKNQELDATRRETDFHRRIDFLNAQMKESRLLLPEDNAREVQKRMVAAISEQLQEQASEQAQAAQLVQRLSEESIQAVAREGLKSMFHLMQAENAKQDQIRQGLLSRMTGQLFEELAGDTIKDSLKDRLHETTRLEFIAGDRIRDQAGRKLTDGVVTWQDAEQRSRRMAFEAKAGAAAAEKLDRELTDLTVRGRAELEQYAKDLAEEEVLRHADETDEAYASRRPEALRDATEDQRAYMELLTEVYIEELLDRSVQEEAGQLQRTNERLSQAQSLYVDGRAREDLGVTDGRSTEVQRVLPKDVAPEQDALRVQITAEQLRRATEAALQYLEEREEELRRRRQEELIEE